MTPDEEAANRLIQLEINRRQVECDHRVVEVRRVKFNGARAYYAICVGCLLRTSPIQQRDEMERWAAEHRKLGGPRA